MKHCVKYFISVGKTHILEGETFFRDNIIYAVMYAGGLYQSLQDGEQTAWESGRSLRRGSI